MTIVNITVENDADFNRVFQYMTVGGVPIPLNAASMVMMLRRHAEDEAAVLRLGTDTGEIIITDMINGIFTILIRQPVLLKLGLGDYAHSNVLLQNGLKRSIWTGTFTNNAGASR